MALPRYGSLWTTKSPAAWPDAPAEMTVTTLAEIESCPRRWALGAGHYPDLWEGRGYPSRVQLNTLAGTVVHLVIETITKALANAGCLSVQDPTALQVMKDLGGYTKVVNDCIDRVLERLTSSPRAKHLLEFAARSLRAQVPNLRTRAQTMLYRVRLPRVALFQAEGNASKTRGPLTVGVFPEIDLRAREIGWKGKADLLVISPDACEITDFKTGVRDEKHHFQIQVYALLWSRETDLNPERRRADRLVLAYETGDVEVAAPNDVELDAIEREIVARGEAAHQAVTRRPPEARPNADHCRYCGVRQLCAEYWTAKTQRKMAEHAEDQRFADVEVTITGRHGPSSWRATVETSSIAKRGQAILLRADHLPFVLHEGQTLRLLGIHLSLSDEQASESQPPIAVATLGAGGEAFIVST